MHQITHSEISKLLKESLHLVDSQAPNAHQRINEIQCYLQESIKPSEDQEMIETYAGYMGECYLKMVRENTMKPSAQKLLLIANRVYDYETVKRNFLIY